MRAMIILGLNLFHADSSAAIFVDGELVFAIAEERLNRQKHFGGFPILSIQACLDAAGVRLEDLDHVAVGRNPKANRTRKAAYALRNPAKLLNLARIRSRSREVHDLKQLISYNMEVDSGRLRFQEHHVEHHVAHAASAFYPSGLEEAATFSFDGSGDFTSALYAHGRGTRLEPLSRVFLPSSLGHFYFAACAFIGYQKYGDEGKVMGLAPYGKDIYKEHFDRMVQVVGNGFRLNPDYFRSIGSDGGLEISDDGTVTQHPTQSEKWVELFGDARAPYSEITDRDKDLAFGVQSRFEEITFHLLRELHELVPTDAIAIAGGCALNSVANGKIFEETPFKQTWIQPAAGDEGLAIGAALYAYHHVLGNPRKFVMRHAYWGPTYSDRECANAIDAAGLSYRKMDRAELIDYAASRLADRAVVGWFQGAAEWGPRALGNRSILTHPGPPEMKDVLNARIKHREWFRPFAPSILEDRQGEYFERTEPSPFMLHVYDVRPERREELGAVTHVDGTGRIQTVSRDQNALYYDLIDAFRKRTGTPVLLNTSFNENEPIVCRPEEAIHCFVRTKMDVLCLGPFVVDKYDQGNQVHDRPTDGPDDDKK